MSRLGPCILLPILAALACTDGRPSGGTLQPSPNASILPAPLASAGDLSGASPRGQGGEGGGGSTGKEPSASDSAGRSPTAVVPEPARLDAPLPADALSAKEAAGYALEAAFRWADLPESPAGPEGASAALREELGARSHRVTLHVSGGGRLRVRLDSSTFPLPAGTELRARSSVLGHALVWPAATAYRYLSPGTLRALFTERRADVSPLLRPKVTPSGVTTVLGHRATRTEVETSLGVLSLEQATLPGATGGELLCRLLLDLAGAEPSAEICRPDRVPLAATYRWLPSGSLSFVVSGLAEQKELPLTGLQMPPAAALWKPGELPPSSSVLAAVAELERLRGRPRKAEARSPAAPVDVLVADNSTPRLLYVLVDGLALAWVPPRGRVTLPGLQPGRYSVAWRDFLGTTALPPADADAPGVWYASPPPADGGAPR